MSEKKINLCLGVHNHQPVGNFDHVMAEACERCYFPFFKVLERHPKVKVSVHFSGYLLHWIAENYPEVINILKKLVAANQVELLTGGYYEPILSIIPDADKIGQIRKLTDYLSAKFPVHPEIEGMWLAERVWEPHLPKALAEAGVKYVCVDDSHFKSVGIRDSDLFRCYVTEEQGHRLGIFPINQDLRYLIPFETPEKIVEYLHSVASHDPGAGAFYFDDGEKFGVWPGTYDSVYTKGWLEHFFALLEKNSSWINLNTFGEYWDKVGSHSRVYLPTASYSEMMEWALPAEQAQLMEKALHDVQPRFRPFLRGGFWRFFLVKYPESNHLHKKMLSVSKQMAALRQTAKANEAQLSEAQDALWMGQSNDPYWHGVFGGLYLTNLRTANFQALVKAEALCDQLQFAQSKTKLHHEIEDFDFDGQKEIVVKTESANYLVAPEYGGALVELDYKKRPFNLIDTLARRVEAYHVKLHGARQVAEVADSGAATIHGQVKVKEDNLDQLLSYDWHRKLCFLDHFLGKNVDLAQFSKVRYAEVGDFVVEPYELVSLDGNASEIVLRLKRDGHIRVDNHSQKLKVDKTYNFLAGQAKLVLEYRLTNTNESPISLWFAPELNFNFLAPDAHDRYFFNPESNEKLENCLLSSQAVIEATDGLGICDQWLGIKLTMRFASPACVWRHPVFTVSNSESGFEKIYQGSTILPNWHIFLQSGQSWSTKIELAIEEIRQ
jgi:alpha-amylase